MINNPFTLKVISDRQTFCDRAKEQKDLISFARSKANVVLYSPRRYGKTSLIRIVQHRLATEFEALVSYTDFFAVSSVEDVAQRIAKSIYKMLEPHETLFRKVIKSLRAFKPVFQPTENGEGFSLTVQPASPAITGIELLERTMEDLGTFLNLTDNPVQITFDEFQEITELKDPRIEGVLRNHIQEHQASYFFVGSRRRLLLDMFVKQNRPFYQSAFNYQLDKLPEKDLKNFIKKTFSSAGKCCSDQIIDSILKLSCCHPYYTQKIAFYIFQYSDTQITDEDVQEAFNIFLTAESFVFESTLQGITPQQIALLKALSIEPSKSIMSTRYMSSHNLKSIGGVQSAVKKLITMDFIEKNEHQIWQIVDPVFAYWLLKTN